MTYLSKCDIQALALMPYTQQTDSFNARECSGLFGECHL